LFADVADAITIRVRLVPVGDARAVVVFVRNAVGIGIATQALLIGEVD
jgi:hypothetical protein